MKREVWTNTNQQPNSCSQCKWFYHQRTIPAIYRTYAICFLVINLAETHTHTDRLSFPYSQREICSVFICWNLCFILSRNDQTIWIVVYVCTVCGAQCNIYSTLIHTNASLLRLKRTHIQAHTEFITACLYAIMPELT